MMTLMAQLCALCAVSALVQMVLPEDGRQGSLRMIGGLLMLHLTLSGLQRLCGEIAAQQDLAHVFEILMK